MSIRAGLPIRRSSPRAAGWRPRRAGVERDEAAAGGAASPAGLADPGGIAEPASGSLATTASGSLATTASARLGGRAIALAGLVVVAGVVLSRLLGFVRTGVLNAEFGGSSSQLGAFNLAFRIPDTLFQLVAAGALGSALVPVASELIARGDEERARRVVGTIANLMIAALLPLAAVLWLVAPILVAVAIDPSSDAAHRALTTDLTRWLLLSPVFLGVGAVMTAGLQSIGIFGPPALAPNVYNVAIIGAALLLTPFLGVHALVIGVVLGAAAHVATQLPSVARHRLYQPAMDLHEPAVRETLYLMAPRALGLGVTQLVFIVYGAFTTLISDSAINIWTTAFVTLQIPVGLIGVPLGIVLLPPLSQAIARGDIDRFRRLGDQSIRLLLFAVIPLSALMFVLAGPLNALLWGHGQYTAADVASTTSVFVVLLAGLVAHVLIALLAPIFYARKDTRTPVLAALLAVAVDIVAAVALFPFFKLEGLALSLGLGAWAEVALLAYLMERRIGLDLRPVARSVALIVPGAALAAAAALLVDGGLTGLLHPHGVVLLVIELAIAGSVAGGVYAAWGRLLRLAELDEAIRLARTLLRRRAAA